MRSLHFLVLVDSLSNNYSQFDHRGKLEESKCILVVVGEKEKYAYQFDCLSQIIEINVCRFCFFSNDFFYFRPIFIDLCIHQSYKYILEHSGDEYNHTEDVEYCDQPIFVPALANQICINIVDCEYERHQVDQQQAVNLNGQRCQFGIFQMLKVLPL